MEEEELQQMQKIKKERIEVKEEENHKLHEENPGNQLEKQTSWNKNEQLKPTAEVDDDQDTRRKNPNANEREQKGQQTDSTQEKKEEHIPDTLERQIEKLTDEEGKKREQH